MTGYKEFMNLFGNITILHVAEFILAIVFICLVYKKIRDYFNRKIKEQNERIEAERLRDEQLSEALSAVRKYPEYRQQSIEIQHALQSQISELKDMYKETTERLTVMEGETKRRERNKLRDRLLQNYRFYVNAETNPSHSWTLMEAEAFWELFKEYEAAGGNGYMHTEVMPAMGLLTVVDPNNKQH